MSAHVVHLTSVHKADDSRIFHKECKSLAAAGYRVTLVVPQDQTDQNQFLDGVEIWPVPKPRGRWERFFRTVPAVYRAARTLDADLYHFHDPELIPVGLLLRWRGKRVVYDVHEDLPSQILSKPWIPRWLRRPAAWLAAAVLERVPAQFHAILAATPAIAAKFPASRVTVRVVRNYPILSELSDTTPRPFAERELAVVYLGGISRTRGAVEMVRALEFIPDTMSIRLKLAGVYLPDSVRDELVKLPGWNRVDELGWLDRPHLVRLLQNVRAGLVVLHPEPNFVEALPIKLFEYMAAGIPVIASDFPLWREIITSSGCGVLVNPCDPHAIARAIIDIATNPEKAEEMGHRGREAVSKYYNWETEQKELLALYGQVLSC